ncbi:MAG: acylphosphatase [Thiobacillus sp.]|nr:acylphosphatase [Thiobacillus sp.]
MKTLRLQITGKVQGVWFRESMRAEAERLSVTGWVCNRADGSVEAMIQGPDEAVDTLVAWTRKGPPLARVDQVVQHAGEGQYTRFDKRAG